MGKASRYSVVKNCVDRREKWKKIINARNTYASSVIRHTKYIIYLTAISCRQEHLSSICHVLLWAEWGMETGMKEINNWTDWETGSQETHRCPDRWYRWATNWHAWLTKMGPRSEEEKKPRRNVTPKGKIVLMNKVNSIVIVYQKLRSGLMAVCKMLWRVLDSWQSLYKRETLKVQSLLEEECQQIRSGETCAYPAFFCPKKRGTSWE